MGQQENEKLVAVGSYNTVEVAHIVAARLNAEGIEAFVEAYRSTDMLSRAADPDGTAVMVRESDVEVAQSVLAAAKPVEDDGEDDTEPES